MKSPGQLLNEAQDAAERLLREAWTEANMSAQGCPPDAGTVHILRSLVTESFHAGRKAEQLDSGAYMSRITLLLMGRGDDGRHEEIGRIEEYSGPIPCKGSEIPFPLQHGDPQAHEPGAMTNTMGQVRQVDYGIFGRPPEDSGEPGWTGHPRPYVTLWLG